jgi:hypothetical protein
MRFARGDMRDHIVSHKTTTDLRSRKNVQKSTFAGILGSSIFDFCNSIRTSRHARRRCRCPLTGGGLAPQGQYLHADDGRPDPRRRHR